jgi:hypothetical protein
MEEREMLTDIDNLRRSWNPRLVKFKEWMSLLKLTDELKRTGMESTVTNFPRTFYNLSHYFLTAGNTQHVVPLATDDPIEMDKQARCERACQYMWKKINERRMSGGQPTYESELAFDLLMLGWYAQMIAYDEETQMLIPTLWHPAQTFPRYEDGQLTACVHEYTLTARSLLRKAKANKWHYESRSLDNIVTLDDYYYVDENGKLKTRIFADKKPITPEEMREDILLLVAPVGGFPEEGIIEGKDDWKGLIGQSILETNAPTIESRNRWATYMLQILRDAAQQRWQEISTGEPKVDPDKLMERGFVVHFQPGESLTPIPSNPIPIEMQSLLISMDRDLQKGGFSDMLYGLMEGRTSGYALTQIVNTANQILLPYQEAKNFIISQIDTFWLKKLKDGHKKFQIKGRTLEELSADDIPEDVTVTVFSELATPKDWLEKATVANYLKELLDEETILEEILKVPDLQLVNRRKQQDAVRKHPMTQNINLASAYTTFAKYLEYRGDREGAARFRKAAQSLEAQLTVPPAGAAKPTEATEVMAQREAGATPRAPGVSPAVTPREELTMRR